VLTGRETVAATSSATGHRRRPFAAVVEVLPGGAARTTTWGELLLRVRHVALGLAGDPAGPAGTLPPLAAGTAVEQAVTLLAAAAAGVVLDVDASGARVGLRPAGAALEHLAAAGARVDAGAPDRFEALLAERACDDPLLRGPSGTHSHAGLLVAARSLAQGVGIGTEDRLLIDLPPGVGRLVASVVVPCLTGAGAWTATSGTALAVAARVAQPTLALLTSAGAAEAVPATTRQRRQARRLPACRVLQVATGPLVGGQAAGTSGALAVEAAGGIVTALGPAGSMGRPLPGVSVGVDDDGAILLRTDAVATNATGLRPDGWLATGLHGRLESGALHLEPEPSTVPAGGAP
jgi:hypothetical protein